MCIRDSGQGGAIKQLLTLENQRIIRSELSLDLKFIFSTDRYPLFHFLWRQPHLEEFKITPRKDDKLLIFSHANLPTEWQ